MGVCVVFLILPLPVIFQVPNSLFCFHFRYCHYFLHRSFLTVDTIIRFSILRMPILLSYLSIPIIMLLLYYNDCVIRCQHSGISPVFHPFFQNGCSHSLVFQNTILSFFPIVGEYFHKSCHFLKVTLFLFSHLLQHGVSSIFGIATMAQSYSHSTWQYKGRCCCFCSKTSEQPGVISLYSF